MPKAIIKALKKYRNIEIQSVLDLELRGASDLEIFKFACDKGYVILTEDISDFAKLLDNFNKKPCIIFLKRKRRKTFGDIAKEIVSKLDSICKENPIFVDP